MDAPAHFPWQAFGASARGANHLRTGQMNQDALAIAERPHGLFLAVSDGHGNARSFRSDRGSRFAVQTTTRELARWARDLPPDLTFGQLRRHARATLPAAIIQAWRDAVHSDILAQPFSFLDFSLSNEPVPTLKRDDELSPSASLCYGATLLAAAITPEFILLAQLGDGDILALFPDGEVKRPMPKDPRIQGHATSSLCGGNPYPTFRFSLLPAKQRAPDLILLATDGYANCYGDPGDFDSVAVDLRAYVRETGAAAVQENLEDWLAESSTQGSGDDITTIVITRAAPGPTALR